MEQDKPKVIQLDNPLEGAFWPEARVLLIPVPNVHRFLAFGVLGESGPVIFVAKGSLDQLGDFIARMQNEGSHVEFHGHPPPRLEALWEKHSGDAAPPFETKNGESPPPPPPG